jgi:hypothetical protein
MIGGLISVFELRHFVRFRGSGCGIPIFDLKKQSIPNISKSAKLIFFFLFCISIVDKKEDVSEGPKEPGVQVVDLSNREKMKQFKKAVSRDYRPRQLPQSTLGL